MLKICSFVFDSLGGKAVTWFGVVLALVVMWQADRAQQRQQAKTDVIQETNNSAAELANAAVSARDGALEPGVVERLRRHSCRDC